MLFTIEEVNIDQIIISPDRARKVFDGIPELAQSIESIGLLNPILLSDDYTLLGGERRLRACQSLSWLIIPCRILNGVLPEDYDVIEYIENKERQDFLWHEELELKLKMHTKWSGLYKKWGYRETAKKLNVSLGGLSSDLELAKIIDKFPDLKNADTKGKAREGFKKLAAQAESIISLEVLPDSEKKKLAIMLQNHGQKEVKSKGQNVKESTIQNAGATLKSSEGVSTADPVESVTTPVSKSPQCVYRICGWRELLMELPDNSVGFCELDPPYAMDFNTLGIYANAEATEIDWTLEQYTNEMTELFPLLYSKMLTKSFTVCWVAHKNAYLTNDIAQAAGFKVQIPGIWCKNGGSSIRPNQNMVSNYETFILLAKDNAVFNTSSFNACINHASVSFASKIHQWEKPREMYQEFFSAMGKPKSLFLSPYAGSGNSMIVAAQNDMLPIGCDINEKYYSLFTKNFKNYFG